VGGVWETPPRGNVGILASADHLHAHNTTGKGETKKNNRASLITVLQLIDTFVCLQVMKTYHMYHTESISAESKLKEAEKQEEKQIGRGEPVFSIRMEDKYQRRSSVKKIEKMKEKVRLQHLVI